MTVIKPHKAINKPYWCGYCKAPAYGEWKDLGIGFTEAWGIPHNHRDIQFVSDCCSADLYEDEELHCPVEPPDDEPEYDPNEDEDWEER